MEIYNCPRCKYQTNSKRNFKRHLNRKFICKSKFSTLDIETIKRRDDVYFIGVGDGPERDRISEIVKKRGFENRIFFRHSWEPPCS